MVLTECTKTEEISIIFMTGYIPESNSFEIRCNFFFSFKHLLNAFFIGNVLRVNAEMLGPQISLHGHLWL